MYRACQWNWQHYALFLLLQDTGIDPDHRDPLTRIYLTRAAQPWHSDSVDIVGEAKGPINADAQDSGLEDVACYVPFVQCRVLTHRSA